jgi:putative addiction module component (TIGR02574 family)
MTTPAQILDAALALSPDQRAEVACQILLSLEPADHNADVDEAWAAEIRRRLRAIRQGETALVDWDRALDEVRGQIAGRNES